MEPQASNKKPLYIMSALGLVVMAAIAFVLTRPAKTPMVTDLYQYFPENTAFYAEVAPGENLSTRFFEALDKLKMNARVHGGHTEMQVAEVFKKDLEPVIAMGTWVVRDANGQVTSTAKDVPFLMAIPLRKGATLESLAADMKVSLSDFNITQDGDAKLLESKTGAHPPMALHNNHLLTASNMATLKEALKEQKTPQSIVDNPLVKKNLGLLPTNRQGTLVAIAKELQSFPQDGPKDPNMDKITELQRQIQAATPVMLASISVEKDQFIKLDSFSPVDLSQIKDESFRKDVGKLFSQQMTIGLPQLLPKDTVVYGSMVGLGQYYDLYMNHIATAENKQAMTGVESQLKMVGLELRKNLISLLDGKAGIGIVAKKEATSPDFLVFLNHSADTQQTMDRLEAMASQFPGTQVEKREMGGEQKMNVFKSVQLPTGVAYSNIQADTMVIGTEAGVEQIHSVQQKKAPALAENPLFKELAGPMPEKVSGVFFVDVQQGASLIDNLAKRSPMGGGRSERLSDVLGGIEGIAGTNSMEGEKMMKGHLTIKLATGPVQGK